MPKTVYKTTSLYDEITGRDNKLGNYQVAFRTYVNIKKCLKWKQTSKVKCKTISIGNFQFFKFWI